MKLESEPLEGRDLSAESNLEQDFLGALKEPEPLFEKRITTEDDKSPPRPTGWTRLKGCPSSFLAVTQNRDSCHLCFICVLKFSCERIVSLIYFFWQFDLRSSI